MFGTYSGFRKHLNTKHFNCFDVNLQLDVAVKQVSTEGEVMSTYVEVTPTSSEMLKDSNKSTLIVCASVVAQFRAAGLSQSTVNSFVTSMEEVFFEIHTQAKEPYRTYLHRSPQLKTNYNSHSKTLKTVKLSHIQKLNEIDTLNKNGQLLTLLKWCLAQDFTVDPRDL